MNVLLANMTLDPSRGGGTAVRTAFVAQALATTGDRCTVLTADDGGEPADDGRRGYAVVRLPVLGGRHRIPWRRWQLARHAVAEADVVLLVNHWAALNVLVWRLAIAAGVPYVVCPAGALPAAGRSPVSKWLYNRLWGRRLVRGAAAWIAIAANELEQFAGYGVPGDRVALIPNGMPESGPGTAEEADSFRRRHGLGPGPLALFLGRLAPIKGPDLLLGAFAAEAQHALVGWNLVLAGPDEGMERALRATAGQSGLASRVRFTGFLDEQRKRQALAAASLLVIPSRREAMSIVVLEAAAAARPVLLTDACGFPQVVDAGGGWVVPATVAGLAEGLRTAAAAGAAGALPAMGEALGAYARERYSWSRVAEQHRTLFAEVLGRRGGAG